MSAALAFTLRHGPVDVLLVEDNDLDAHLARDAFEEVLPRTRIRTARSGEEALEWLSESGAELPDLVLLDLKLPGVSGQEVLRQLKSSSRCRRVPVLVFSSSSEVSDRASSYDAGANGYLIKPRDFVGYLEVIRAVGEFWVGWNSPPPVE